MEKPGINNGQISQLPEFKPIYKHPERRQIHGVPPQLRLRRQQGNDVYDPLVVSIGPYHHGKPELRKAEEFKYLCLDWYTSGDDNRKAFFYSKILENIDEIRSCYAEVSVVEKFDDRALALMMLLDCCFIINFMHNSVKAERNNFSDWWKCLGSAASTRFTARDIMVLENQIPFQVVMLLIILQYEDDKEAHELIDRFLSWMMIVDQNQAKCYREYAEPPVHLLEAFDRALVGKLNTQGADRESGSFQMPHTGLFFTRKIEGIGHKCRSVMDLKAKGIRFKPSSSSSLKDITFKSRGFYAQLQLPVRYYSDLSKVFIYNVIAFEISPNASVSDPIVLSYIIFMKSLIESSEDVKELQERGVLFNRFSSHEQVVKLFKEIDTLGLVNLDIFMDVKQGIERHCNSMANTWITDLIHTRFRNPWSVIGLLAASFLLCLTLLQTCFTVHPVK